MRTCYRLRPDEGVLYVGITPPAAKYFSFASYLAERFVDGAADETRMIFAECADPINLDVVRTEESATAPFLSLAVFLVTADRRLQKTVQELLATQALAEILNVDPLPLDHLRLGWNERDDLVGSGFRIARFADANDGEAYVRDIPFVVMRITPIESSSADPLPTSTFRPRGTNTTEESLRASLDSLTAAVRQKHAEYQSRLHVNFDPFFQVDNYLGCIDDNIPCLGATRDAIYGIQRTFLLEGKPERAVQDFVVIVGVNHRLTGKATYSSLSIYHTRKNAGIGSVTDTDMEGSAVGYLPDDPNAPFLFAYTFARNCSGAPFCFEIGYTYPGVPEGSRMMIWSRAYLEPPTSSGPLQSEILMPRQIWFQTPQVGLLESDGNEDPQEAAVDPVFLLYA
eukprot:TRINITY_DN1924_c0_g1_i1.p1 TRINITY_DN1924_c0_g1~~TRINITY_DN1924_c0_g1_i1.p1  ORF type:complete len:397 (+),score=80.90 TRINITY_DN1924_c0_g1_i1:323-1513(+)